jgi:23S rRNA pseudouridine1911/1915/1917 synthase
MAQVSAMPSTAAEGRPEGAVDLVPTAESLAFRPEPMALNIVYEDADLLVIDKPAGLVVHPAAGNWSGTLLNGLLAHHAGRRSPAACRHRAPARQGHLRRDGGRQDAGRGDGLGARHRGAPGASLEYLALAHGEMQSGCFEPFIEAPDRARPGSRSGWPWSPAASRLVPMSSVPGRAARWISAHCAAHCTPAARIRSAFTLHQRAPLGADATYGGRPALGMVRQALACGTSSFVHPDHRARWTSRVNAG